MTTLFISYATEDRPFAGQLAAALTEDGLEVWWDKKLLGGQDFEILIEEQLQKAQCVLVVWSHASLRSRWVKGEARVGLDREVLIPIIREAVNQPLDFRTIHSEDLSTWDGSRSSPLYLKLRQSIERLVGPPTAGVVRVEHGVNSLVLKDAPPLSHPGKISKLREKSLVLGLSCGVILGFALAVLVNKITGSTASNVVAAFIGSVLLGLVVGGIVDGRPIAAKLAVIGAILVTVGLVAFFPYQWASPLIGIPVGTVTGATVGRLIDWYRRRYAN